MLPSPLLHHRHRRDPPSEERIASAAAIAVMAEVGAAGAVAAAAAAAAFHGDAAPLGLSPDGLTAAFPAGSPALSADERKQLLAGTAVSGGLLCMAVAQLQTHHAISTAALALSCEALRASSKSFAAKIVEPTGSKEAAAAAADVVTLLERSTFANAKPKDGGIGIVPEMTQVRLCTVCCLFSPIGATR